MLCSALPLNDYTTSDLQLSFAVLQIVISELLSQNRQVTSNYIGPRDRKLYFVFSVYYNKHLISEQPQLDVACKVFLELVLQIIFLSFYSPDFPSNSK